MSNTFLFIIPLTPPAYLTEDRQKLRNLCLTTLISQNYSGWKALLVGKPNTFDPKDDRFVLLDFEGHKEEKLQKATEYIIENKIQSDYMIRLDDDDIFNPGILKTLKDKNFDLCVDRYHSFWNITSGQMAQKVMYWFPNTCIHKSEHALHQFGSFPPGEYIRYKTNPLLIENEHNDFNKYYSKDNKIIYTSKSNPLYVRSLGPGSITSLQSSNFQNYLKQHGYWKMKMLYAFKFLRKEVVGSNQVYIKQGFTKYLKERLYNLITLRNYHKVVINK